METFQEYTFSFSKPEMLWIYQACVAMLVLHKKKEITDDPLDVAIDKFAVNGLNAIMEKISVHIPKFALKPIEKSAVYQAQGLTVQEWQKDFEEEFTALSEWLIRDDHPVRKGVEL